MTGEVYRCVITFTEPLLGSTPKSTNLFERFVAARAAERADEPEAPPGPAGAQEEEIAAQPASEEGGWTIFPRNDEGLFLWDYQVKGFWKESGNNFKDLLQVKNLRAKLDNYLFIRPRMIPLMSPTGVRYLEAPDVLERPLRAMTQQGPRTSLARSERVPAGSWIEFDIHALAPVLNEDGLRTLAEYGEWKGLGQWRNGGWGAFTFTLSRATLATAGEVAAQHDAARKARSRSRAKAGA